ncbi:MAG: biotin-dependent carboxyltransferase family protein, partial [Burkholderiales bacterium]
PCGAMDPVALELANALVGNQAGEAALEITLLGPEILFTEDALIALCGAELEAKAEGSRFPLDRPVLVKQGTRLATGRARRGSRAYLAVAGGIAVELVLGSRSTYLPAKFGGLEGRALRTGDELALAPDASRLAAERYERLSARTTARAGTDTVRWSAPALTLPDREPIMVHAMEGRHHAQFDAPSRRVFFDAAWRISPDSNRMGFRLAGAALAPAKGGEILSEPTCLGTVQVPAGGAPIVLMADHQTTGGYPKIAEIASADVPRLAQLAPGGTLRFARCSLEEALELRRALRQRIDSALRAIAWQYGR